MGCWVGNLWPLWLSGWRMGCLSSNNCSRIWDYHPHYVWTRLNTFVRVLIDFFQSIFIFTHEIARKAKGPLLTTVISFHFHCNSFRSLRNCEKLLFTFFAALMTLIRNVIQFVHILRILQMAVSRHISCIAIWIQLPFLNRIFITVRLTT